jgi:hypothetical protein
VRLSPRRTLVWGGEDLPCPWRERLEVGSVMVRSRSVQADDAWISSVHLYDGETRVAAHEGLDHRSAVWTWPRFGVPGHPEVRWEVGVSIQLALGGSPERMGLPTNAGSGSARSGRWRQNGSGTPSPGPPTKSSLASSRD